MKIREMKLRELFHFPHVRIALVAGAAMVLCVTSFAQVTITDFNIPTSNGQPWAIATGPDGNLWFTENTGNKIGKITPAGIISEFNIPSANAQPFGIATGPDGNLWFTEGAGDKIGKITPAGVITEFNIPTPFSHPKGIATGPDGNLWFTEGINRIGKITPAGAITEFNIPTPGGLPLGIVSGQDGNLWFTEWGGNKIGKITPAGAITEFDIPTPTSYPFGIAAGPDGNLWFTEDLGNKIGQITPAGAITEFNIPTSGSLPLSIVSGPDGQLWFTENTGNKIGKITPDGAISELPTSNGGPRDIVLGPEGNLWFTEPNSNKIGRLTISPCPLTVSPALAAVPGMAGTYSLTISGGSCGWTAFPSVSWLRPSPAYGTGSTSNVSVAPNTGGVMRSGTITLRGQTVTVLQAANNPGVGPVLVSLNPFQGSGPNATLTLVYSHPNGWPAIQSAELIVNPRWESTQRSGGCYVKYAPITGLFTLIADDGNGVAGTTVPGSTTNVSNSQCTLNAAGSSATGNGSDLTLVVALTFSASFGGQRHIWMQASDYNNLSTNWLVYGVWFPTQTTVSAGPWYRIYDPFSKSYLYSADSNEYNTLGARGFRQEGISGLVMSGATTVNGTSNIAWYRVYVSSTNSHFWTSDRNEFLTLVNLQQAYVGEGVAAFVVPYLTPQGTFLPQPQNMMPFWRAAYQGANLHFWTSDADEYNGTNGKHLPAGYAGEGIACYIFPASGAVGIGSSAQFNDETAAPLEDDGVPAVVTAVNGASYVSNGVIAPGQMLTVYGRHLGGRVLMNGVPAEVIAAQDNEIRVVAPKELAGATEVSVEVEHRGRRSRSMRLEVVTANPAIFGSNEWGRGNAQAQNEDGTINDAQHGAARGTAVTLYTTGVNLDLPLEVHIGGVPADVISAQQSGARAGVTEVRVRVPETVEAAAFQPVVLHVGNLFSQPGVGLAIR
jgi:uncharacterized protein (TIGR03437 family)